MANLSPKYPQVLIGNASAEHALHDSNEIAAPVVGFVPDADGTFEGRLRGDSADRTMPVLGGVFYPWDIKLAKSTGSTGTVSELFIVRWQPLA